MTRRGRKALDGLSDDLRDHIEHQTEENLARGMTPDEARRQARLALGNPTLIEEDTRAVWVWRWLEDLRRDLRYALRTFRRSPGFAATAVVSLALGIAAATGLFSIVNAALLHPFPFADIDQIVRLDTLDKGTTRRLFVTARQFVALQQSEVLDGAFALNTWEMTLTGQDFPETVQMQDFSANGLDVLRVPPLLGRVFHEADGPAGEQAQRVVVLTYRFWQRHFGGRPEAVGQTLSLNHEPYTVIGVLPRQYFSTGPEIVVPIDLTFDPNVAWNVQARLKHGVTPRQAEQRLQPLFDQFAKEAPKRFSKEVRPLVRTLVETQWAAGFVPTLLLIFAASRSVWELDWATRRKMEQGMADERGAGMAAAKGRFATVKTLGIIWGFLFLLGGVLGFVPGITKNEMFLGFFMVNTAHNILHITSGAIFLIASVLGARAARMWFQIFGSFYVALSLIGFWVGNHLILNLISNSLIDSWGHAFLGFVLLLIGFATRDAISSSSLSIALPR